MIASLPRPSSLFILSVSFFVLSHVFSVSIDGATEDREIEGSAIERAVDELHRLLNDRAVDENPLEEILDEGAPSLAERYEDARIRLRKRHAADSLVTRPEVRLSVFIEEEDRLSAELWKVHFVPDGDGWKAARYRSILAARLGFRFSLREDEVYAFDRLTIEGAAGVFLIEDGMLMPGFSGDRIGRVVLTGKGRFTFTPPDRVERQQMNKYARTSNPVYTTRFDNMVLVLSPEGYENLVEGAALSRVKGGRTFNRAEALLRRVDRDYLMDMEPARERFLRSCRRKSTSRTRTDGWSTRTVPMNRSRSAWCRRVVFPGTRISVLP